jgi:hypothetical protein
VSEGPYDYAREIADARWHAKPDSRDDPPDPSEYADLEE